jgi:hypothetical protein
VAVREVYASYYSEMGGLGAAPEPKASARSVDSGVMRSQGPRKSQRLGWPRALPTDPCAEHPSRLLIFVAMLALIAAYRIFR